MCLPQSVKKDTPAERSQVLPLDVLLGVNGVAVGDASLGRAKKLIANSGDQMLLSVMASSSYRLLTTRRDMMSLMRTMPRDSVLVTRTAFSCGSSKPYGIGVEEAQVWDDKTNQFSRTYVLTVW